MKMLAAEALSRLRSNTHSGWNRTASSSSRSASPEDASNRIFDGFAQLNAEAPLRAFALSDPVFTMGSCFARELEWALVRNGGNVISMDKPTISNPAFFDSETGRFRDGFFHRFTPRAMLQEFQRCFDEIPWTDDALVFTGDDGLVVDCHYWHIRGMDASREAIARRRVIAKELVCRVREAKLIVLTLGLTESWKHVASGLSLNWAHPKIIRKDSGAYAFERLSYDEVVACLEGMHDLISRHHRDGQFQMVVTVSPVPLSATFSGQDIVVANMESKSILRAAARAFVDRHENVSYFPSYEMVLYSAQEKAWRPDRIHVNPELVAHITGRFVASYLTAPAPAL